MADIQQFFSDTLPKKLNDHPDLASSINAVYQFNLGDGGSWIVDLTQPGGAVSAGTHDAPGCTVSASGADFGKLLDNPGQAMFLFTMGRLKVSNISLGMQLQKLLS